MCQNCFHFITRADLGLPAPLSARELYAKKMVEVWALTDQAKLSSIALEDKDADIRLSAVGRLMDQALLGKLVVESNDVDVRVLAVWKLDDLTVLAGVAKNDKDAGVRQAAINKQAVKVKIMDLGGGVQMELVLIAPGSFNMGSIKGKENELPVHEVQITEPFYIGKYDVTQEQWQKIMGTNPSRIKGPKYPVTNVSWDDCQLFLEKLNKQIGGSNFFLPTEAQWEYAYRAGSTSEYYWGDNEAMLSQYAWIFDYSGGRSHAVGEKKPNVWGLYDMSGNVWEWCADWYDAGYYKNSPQRNPTGSATGTLRVLRGSAWNDNTPDFFRAAHRLKSDSTTRNHYIGFRCVLRSPFTIAPTSAVVGTVVTITGTDLDKTTSVTFNGIAAKTITDNTATSLKVSVPEGATSGKLVVTAAGGTVTNSYDFIVLFGLKTNAKDNTAMVWIPGSTFTIGSPAGVGEEDEQPAHQVTLSGYWIYRNDVTVAQYRAFCTTTGRALPTFPSGFSWRGKTGWDDPALQQHPIVNVSWNDAKAYADWAGVTLPTEAQWEYAACGPQGNNYPWGGTATKDDKYNGWDVTKCANYANSSKVDKSTWPVGSFPAGASWCGALDMAGNVWQWCGDWYGKYDATAVTNPTGPATGERRVLRGGSWSGNYYDYRSAYRINYIPVYYGLNVGFRCVSLSPGP
ncbi:MAG: SUMF1/EgtB/PvdO family nonheme iron enzyme [bacterium]